ncbi:MAG: molecular chaperone [Anaerolineae bacterium]
MNPLEVALARANAYALFETLFLRGITPSTVKALKQVPELAEEVNFDRGFDELAADHYSLFVHNIPAYASVFLEESGQPGGDITEKAAKAFKDCGYQRKGTSEAADHIGHIAGCLSFLCGAEADAWIDGLPKVAGQMRQIQVELLENQLLSWIFPFLWAVRSHEDKFFSALSDLTTDIAADHYKSLSNLHSSFSTPLAKEASIGDMGNDETSVHDIVDFLLKPARSGLWFSSDKIGKLGREFELPRGFGERKTILLNMIKAAGKYEEFVSLTDKLSEEYSSAHINFEEVRTEQPHLARFLFPWSLKIGGTHAVLHRLQQTWAAAE